MRPCAGIAALAAAAFACAAGCSFLIDSGGLAPDAPDAQASSTDAANGTTETGSAVTDGRAGDDATTPSDAATSGDASTPADGGGPPQDGGSTPTVGCGAYADASFCVDFEQANALSTATWTGVNGGITLTTSSAISPTHSAKIDLASGAPACTFVRLTRQFSGVWTNVRGRASVNPSRESIPIVWQVHLTTGVDYNILGIFYADARLSVRVQKYDANANTVTNLAENAVQLDAAPFNAWSDVELTVQTSPTRLVVISAGGKQTSVTLPNEVPLTDPSVSFGFWCDDVPGTMLVDDVAAWVR